MTDNDLSSILKRSGLSLTASAGSIRVLVELRVPSLAPSLRRELEAVGLKIDEAIGNKVFGTLEAGNRSSIEQLNFVAGVENSVQLKPHRQVDSTGKD
jgi:hypothetical protein